MERSTARAVKTYVKLVNSLSEVRASDIVMALRSVICSKIPMVIILGATGTGKTKLGIELAQRFGSEIISADSMQIYKGLDIVTAKASPAEQELVKHHLLDILEPHQMFTVVDFRNRALRIIENLINQGKVPIIVGGTNYYIESIVYNILVENMSDSDALLWDKSRRKRDSDDDMEERSKRVALDTIDGIDHGLSPKRDNNIDITKLKEDIEGEMKLTNDEIHERLKTIDPKMASRLHPNNRRKILRSLEVWLKTGRRHSDVLEEQKTSEGKLRRPEATVILWLKCDQEVHDQRLNARVDSMIEDGLINELLDFHDRHNKQRIKDGRPPDYTKGVFQTLGLKEFHEFLMLPVEKKNSEEGKKLLEESIDNMKMGTRRYARRQNKMVKGRFLEHPNREIPLIYELDTTDLTKWDEEVKNKAIVIINSLVNNSSCEYSPVKENTPENLKNLDRHSSNYCEVCERLIIGDKEYSIHLNSNKHKKVMKLKKKLAINTPKEENMNK